MVTPDWLIIERGITMTRQDIETGNTTAPRSQFDAG